jgi:nitroreductase
MKVDEAILARKSVRAFKPEPIPLETLRDLLDVARFSPSGGNLQPWRMIVVSGDELKTLTQLAQTTLGANPRGEADEHPIYPATVTEPYRSRRYKVGEDMYAILGIGREDKMARLGQMAQNYAFFGAPVAIFFVIDKSMGHGQWAHMGMLMQTICLAAQARGLGSCMQEAWGMVRKTLATHFGLPDNEMIYCAMALGYEDQDAPINTLRTTRADLDEIAVFRGFEA